MKGKMRKILLALCIIGAGVCLGFSAHYYTKLQKNKKIYEELQTPPETGTADTKTGETETETGAKAEIPINFEELWKINPEIYAWIEIPGTDVNYPVVQSAADNSYYLDHTIEGIAGYPGSIYTEALNKKDFSDFNTLIYGHDMEDGSMFGGLHKFRDGSYLKDHETMIIYTTDHKYTYRIFSAVTYDDRHIMGAYDFTSLSQREDYLHSIGNTDPAVTTDSRLITLSTCIADQPDHRFLVEAVLVNEE